MMIQDRSGFTLVELIVTMAIIAVAAGLSTFVLVVSAEPPLSLALRELAAARDAAIRGGERVLWRGDSQVIVFYPDGSSGGGGIATADQRFVVDRLTGATHAIP